MILPILMNETPKLTPDQLARAVWAIDIKPKFNITEMARRVGVSKGTIHNWVRVPEQHVQKVSDFTRMAPHELRPDLFSDPDEPAPWDDVDQA